MMKLLTITTLNVILLASSLYAHDEAHDNPKHGKSSNMKINYKMPAQQHLEGFLEAYLTIQKSLSKDSIENINTSATKLANEVKKSEVEDSLRAKIESAAETLAKTENIKDARSQFKKLSELMLRWQATAKPVGVKGAYCPMAKASWLQAEKEMANPYYGSKMLKCGDWVN